MSATTPRPGQRSARDQPSTRARSRSRNFCIFPVRVFGSGPNTTVRGAL